MSTPLVVIDCRTFLMQRFVGRQKHGPTVTIRDQEQHDLVQVAECIEEYREQGLP